MDLGGRDTAVSMTCEEKSLRWGGIVTSEVQVGLVKLSWNMFVPNKRPKTSNKFSPISYAQTKELWTIYSTVFFCTCELERGLKNVLGGGGKVSGVLFWVWNPQNKSIEHKNMVQNHRGSNVVRSEAGWRAPSDCVVSVSCSVGWSPVITPASVITRTWRELYVRHCGVQCQLAMRKETVRFLELFIMTR
jgi:hypothetical protein